MTHELIFWIVLEEIVIKGSSAFVGEEAQGAIELFIAKKKQNVWREKIDQ